MTERNEPCPCGSGKKYKKCCGAAEKPLRDYIGINRAVAYRGEIGRQREAFCKAYSALKASRFGKIEEKLREELADTGETVTCGPGCAYCCSHYVQASFMESEAIVSYLYSHEKEFQYFLKAYNHWRERVSQIEPVFQRLNDFGGKIAAGQSTEEERAQFKKDTRAYKDMMIPCPFLDSGKCSIYGVRPYVCAGYFSVSPPDWCEANHPKNHDAMHVKISLKLGADVPYFLQIKANPLYASPLMVKQILDGGYGAIAQITGIPELPGIVREDPEVQAVLRATGVL